MDLLTVKEVAGLKGCSERYIRKLIAESKLKAMENSNPANHAKEYIVPASALPVDLQRKYYEQRKAEVGLPPELKPVKIEKKSSSKAVKKAFEEYTAEEREEIALWCKILKDWQEKRIRYKNKTKADPDFVGYARITYPEVQISVDILYRKYAAFVNHDYEGLVDKRGGWNKGSSAIDETVWLMFTRLYLQGSQPKVSRCYEDLQKWIKVYYPEMLSSIPSERTFRRRIDEIPGAVIEYTRFGKKSCFDKYCEYIERNYVDLQANEIWIADNHTLDVITLSDEGKPHRLSLTTFMDAKSGVIVGWNVCDNPCSQSTLLAIRASALRGFGLPFGMYLDNGSEFLTHDFAGRGHRTKASWNPEDTPPTILSLLGITMTNALVKNAKAKNIERFFYTFKEWISKAFDGYCGGTILERPEELAKLVKAKKIPTDQQIRELLPMLIDGGYNATDYGGKEPQFKGMSRIDVWNESINCAEVEFRDAADEDLTLLLARTTRYQKIKRNGVCIELWGKKIWYKDENTVFEVGREVYVRYDPANLSDVRVYDKKTDQYLWTYARADYLDVAYNEDDKDKIQTAMQNIRRSQKAVKKKVSEYTGFEGIDLLEARLNAVQENFKNFEIKRPSRITPVTAGEINAQYPERGNILSVEFAELKAMNDKREKDRRIG